MAEGTVSDADYKQIQAECIEHLEAEHALRSKAMSGPLVRNDRRLARLSRGPRAGGRPGRHRGRGHAAFGDS